MSRISKEELELLRGTYKQPKTVLELAIHNTAEELKRFRDIEEQGRLVEIVRCEACKWFKPNQAQGKELGLCIVHGGVYRKMDFCNSGALAELKGTEE